LVALTRALERDETRPREDVVTRDRRIATSLPTEIDDRLVLPLAWLDVVNHEDKEVATVRMQTGTALHWAGFLVAILGLATGVGAALGAFYYDGGSRVNVVGVLGIFIVLPGLLLLPFILAVMPSRWIGWIPGANAASTMVRSVSPGRLGLLVGVSFRRHCEILSRE